MQYFRLQFGCLLIMLYIITVYVKDTLKSKTSCNKLFDAFMYVAPWAVVFDGVTAWTVNNLDTVPAWLNSGAHLLFFMLMDVCIVITALYFYSQLVEFKNKTKGIVTMSVPGLISLILIIAGFKSLYYIQGETTWYSYGFPVFVCYITLILYYGAILFLLVVRKRFIARDKMMTTLTFILVAGLVLLVQMVLPEALVSAVIPTFLMLGIYLGFENPATQKLKIQHNNMVAGFATMVESKDDNTGGHIKRTRAYVDLMVDKMRRDKRYSSIFNRDYMEDISNAAPLHDIGKIATPDSILQKPGKLTDEEFDIMKQHSAQGGEIILETFKNVYTPEFRKIAYEVARYHHEKFNGRGYPEGLKGDAIPLHARIMAIADVFDAISQKRCYREAMPIEECFAIIEKGIGTDFDPDIAQIFLDAKDEVIMLMNTHPDEI
ncbi:MAG: HD domain-containing protein [Eubacteriales bacterium]|nr:HD domain-containing protein [Eubacteriales bacterium]